MEPNLFEGGFAYILVGLISSTAYTANYDEIIESQAFLSDEALFVRCYSHLTQNRAPYDHPIRTAVRNGTVSATDACMQVFDKAMISTGTGELNSSTDLDGIWVLNTFFNFHKSWFSLRDFSEAPQTYAGNRQFHYDAANDACFITHALFSGNDVDNGTKSYQNGYDFQGIVTSNRNVQCSRTEPTRETPRNFKYYSAEYLSFPPWANAPGRGFLIGTKERPEFDNIWYTKSGRAISSIDYVGGGASQNIDNHVPHTHGAGLIGSTGFLSKYGQSATRSNGAEFVHRRIASKIMEELLCRKAPYRRIEDVSGEVADFNVAHPNNFTIPFRRDTNCMSCHSTQDSMAFVFRNVHFGATQGAVDWNDNGVFGRPDGNTNYNRLADSADKTFLVRSYNVSQAEEGVEPHLVVNDTRFHLRPPKGRLVYRSYDGTEVDHDIDPSGAVAHPEDEGIQILGQLIAAENDLYVCAASKYFEFFTGVAVDLSDPGDARNTPLTAADQHYKQKVIDLGLRLKQHQSLRSMVYEIITSDTYRRVGLRDTN